MNRFFTRRKTEIEIWKKLKNDSPKTRELIETPYSTKEERQKLHLTFTEINEAELKLLKYIQHQMFTSTSKEKLSSFKIMKDKNGLHVLKTKIFNRVDNFNFRCPILLDGNHDIVCMLIRETHETIGHAGTQITINYIRERFWIISLRKIVKKIIAKCVICQKQKAKQMTCEAPPYPPIVSAMQRFSRLSA